MRARLALCAVAALMGVSLGCGVELYDQRIIDAGERAARGYLSDFPDATRAQIDDFCDRLTEAMRGDRPDDDVRAFGIGCHREAQRLTE